MRQLARHSLLVMLVAMLVATGLVSPAQARAFPGVVPLPDGFQPEGVAIRKAPFAYFGSRVDGDIYRANLRTGKGRVFSQGPGAGSPSLGMKLDGRDRLFVAGGSGGDGRVVSTRTGKILRSWTFTTSQNTFVNDVVLTRRAAYFTDSSSAVLYRVPLGQRLARQSDVTKIRLKGQWRQTPGFNANGIAQTPNHRALLVIQSSTGKLYRVNRATGRATQVDLGSTVLTAGDGLLVVGRTLYAVQNQLNRVAVVRLNRAGTDGTLKRRITSSNFDVPTTVARFRGSLYAPNARFTTPPTPTTPYGAVKVSR